MFGSMFIICFNTIEQKKKIERTPFSKTQNVLKKKIKEKTVS